MKILKIKQTVVQASNQKLCFLFYKQTSSGTAFVAVAFYVSIGLRIFK